MKQLAITTLLATTGLLASAARAAPINPTLTYNGTSGDLSAQAVFSMNGNQLQIALTNTSLNDVLVPTDVLTGVFFDITGKPTLAAGSATIATGSTVEYGSYPTGGNVGGEWAFKSGLSGAPGSASYGLSASGLNLFGPSDVFGGPNLSGPTNTGGLDWGLVSAGDLSSTGNGGVTKDPLVKDSVIFDLTGLPQGFNLSSINNVHFQYGTSTSEPGFDGSTSIGRTSDVMVPEPTTPALLTAGVAMFLTRRRHKPTAEMQA